MKLLDREKARARFVIGKERKEIAKHFQNVQQTTGQSELGIPSTLHDKDVCSSEHYRCGLVISNRRLKQWRRQEELLQKHVTKEVVKDEEELTDRQIVLNNLLAEIRNEYDNFNEMTRPRSRPVKELRMPHAAHPSTLDVFESLRTEDDKLETVRPATAPVQRIRHRNEVIVSDPEPVVPQKWKNNFNIHRWERAITREYIVSSRARCTNRVISRPHSAQVPLQTISKVCIEPILTNGQSDTPLFTRVNKHLTEDRGILKIRPHSASFSDESKRNIQERPKSSPPKGKSALKSNSTNTMTSASLNHLNMNKPVSLTTQVTSKSSVAFDLRPNVHDMKVDYSPIANGGDDDDPDVTSDRQRKSVTGMAPDAIEMNEQGGEDVDESSHQIVFVEIPHENKTVESRPDDTERTKDGGSQEDRPGTAESGPRKTSSAIRKVSFHDPYRPGRKVSHGVQDDRDRKISSSSTGSGYGNRPGPSIDILRKKQLLINIDARGSINKRLTNANRTESRESLSGGTDENPQPTGPPQWRRELLRDAPPGLYSPAEKPKVYMTMSKSARKKELEKMVESNTSNLRDMIISEKERRAQSRLNMQKSMAELDSIHK
jgi:hypothetical protein